MNEIKNNIQNLTYSIRRGFLEGGARRPCMIHDVFLGELASVWKPLGRLQTPGLWTENMQRSCSVKRSQIYLFCLSVSSFACISLYRLFFLYIKVSSFFFYICAFSHLSLKKNLTYFLFFFCELLKRLIHAMICHHVWSTCMKNTMLYQHENKQQKKDPH